MSFLTALKPYLWAATLVALIMSYAIGHHHGTVSAETKNELVVAQLNKQAREDELAHAESLNVLATQLQKVNKDAELQIADLRTQFRAGTRSLYLPAICPVQAPAGDALATGAGNEARAKLDPETAESLISITEDGDKAIRQLNAVIDAYNALRIKQAD